MQIDLTKLSKKDYNKLKQRGIFLKTSPKIGFIIGLGDFFGEWNFSKRQERIMKSLMRCNCQQDVSAQPPDFYAERFKNFVENKVLPTYDSNNFRSSINMDVNPIF